MAGLIRGSERDSIGEGYIGVCNDMWTNVTIVRLERDVRKSMGDRLAI